MSERPTQTREVQMPTPDGVIRGRVAVSSGPLRLAALVATAQQITNALVDRANGLEVLNNKTVSCKAGCAACCRQMVPVSPPEVFYLIDLIDSLEPQRRQALLARFEQIDHTLEQHGMIAELLSPTWTDSPVLPIARRYFELQLACPFLEEESCSIHPQRPVGCRDYNVTSPATWCARPYEHEVAKVPMPIPLSVPLARLTAALTGSQPRLIPLTLAPRWAREHADLRTRTWPGLALFDAFLEEIRVFYTSGPGARS